MNFDGLLLNMQQRPTHEPVEVVEPRLEARQRAHVVHVVSRRSRVEEEDAVKSEGEVVTDVNLKRMTTYKNSFL